MNAPVLLISGAATPPADRERLEAAQPSAYVDGPGKMAALPEAVRTSIRAIATRGHDSVTGAHMDLFPNLAVIAHHGVGYDPIDVVAASARGIRVTNTPDVLTDNVADLAIGLMIAQARTMLLGSEWIQSGRWPKEGEMPLNRQVTGSTAGVLGLGRIGRGIAERLQAFKMDIHYHSRSEKETPGWTYHADPVDLARAVDFLFVALVGGPETAGYVSREVIAALGPRGVLINVSRGTAVDEGALLDALESGAIAGAGLDVFLNEPNIDPRFLKLGNVVLQPHQGSGSVETREAMARLQLANVNAFFDGKPLPTPVN